MSSALFWAGMRLAQWAANKIGGGSSGGYGHGGAVAGGHDDDIPVVAEGYLPDSTRFKWVAVPAAAANRVTLGPKVCTCEHFMELAEAELRKADRKGRYAEAEGIAYTIGYVRGTRNKAAEMGYVAFIVDVS